MRKREIAQPYAAALVELANLSKTPDLITTDLYKIVDIFKQNYELRQFLLNPLQSKTVKKKLFEKIFTPFNINRDVINFINLLIERSRIELIIMIAEIYAKTIYASAGGQIAFISSVLPFTEKQENFIIKQLKSKLNVTNILVYYALDSSLLGGLKIYIGSNVIDLSLKGQLLNMAENLELGSKFQLFKTGFDSSFSKEIKKLQKYKNSKK